MYRDFLLEDHTYGVPDRRPLSLYTVLTFTLLLSVQFPHRWSVTAVDTSPVRRTVPPDEEEFEDDDSDPLATCRPLKVSLCICASIHEASCLIALLPTLQHGVLKGWSHACLFTWALDTQLMQIWSLVLHRPECRKALSDFDRSSLDDLSSRRVRVTTGNDRPVRNEFAAW